MTKKKRQFYQQAKQEKDAAINGMLDDVSAMFTQPAFDRSSPDYEKTYRRYVEKEMKAMLRGLSGMGSRAKDKPAYSAAPASYYYTKTLMRRRCEAIARCVPEAVKRFAGKYPEISVEADFCTFNTIPSFYNYDQQEERSYIAVACAIFILDELQRTGRLEEAGQHLPRKEEFADEVWLPEDFHDCVFDYDLVCSLVWLIQNRGAGEKGSDSFKVFINDASVRVPPEKDGPAYSRKEEGFIPGKNRTRLRAILAMMRPSVRRRAQGRFEEKAWEAFDLVIRGCAVYRKKLRGLHDELMDSLTQLRDRPFEGMNLIPDAADTKALVPPLPAQTLDFSYSSRGFRPYRQHIELPEEMEEETDTFSSFLSDALTSGIFKSAMEKYEHALGLYEQCQDLFNKQHRVFLMAAGASEYRMETLSENLEPEPIALLRSLTVDNPYEICYAFLSLLEEGSDLPWLINMGSCVITAAAQLLPWTKTDNPQIQDDEENEFDEFAEEEDVEAAYGSGAPDILKGREDGGLSQDRIEAEDALYRQNYTDAGDWPDPDSAPPDKLYRWNLPQLVYTYTGLVMPRSAGTFDGETECLKASGVPAEDIQALKRYLELADSLPVEYRSLIPLEEAPEAEENAGEDGPATLDIEQIQADNQRLRQELRQLKASLTEAERSAAAERKSREKGEAEHEAERKELYELRELIYRINSGGQEEDSPPGAAQVSFPYTVRHRIVVFGGHATWLKAIQPMLPDVRFVDKDALPNTNMIRHADMVWIQTNAISHKYFFKIIDVVRQHKIDVHYFGYASAEKCALQLAEADRQ